MSSTSIRPIREVAATLGIADDDLIPYGDDKAKIRLSASSTGRHPGRLVLVSAITPTASGEGKTTMSIGLAEGLSRLGESVCLSLREPSLGPVFGRKGGATGGGRAVLHPATDINLHFTGDLHAITSAHNLLSALLDSHLHHGNALGLDLRRVMWRRVIDLGDRALRNIVTGLGGRLQGVPRETGFDITAASEVMAILCLAEGPEDLRERLSNILVGLNSKGEAVTADQLKAVGSMMVLLKDALLPNLVQTSAGVPALVHGGPFANIAHGCSSVLATRMALSHADWAVTEAGFGFDLGAEKFFDIKCTSAGLDTAAVVLVATVRALKRHGGVLTADLDKPDSEAVTRGSSNLRKHIESIRAFGEVPVVALNRFAGDTDDEILAARTAAQEAGAPFAVCDAYSKGAEGAVELAQAVIDHAEKTSQPFKPLYDPADSIPSKMEAIATTMYGASGVVFTPNATREMKEIVRLGYDKLPLCVAKAPGSLSDDPKRVGRPEGFSVTVRSLSVSAGAGFVVALLADVLRMPGMSASPQAERIDLIDGVPTGLMAG
jgi:formate--tetrahydrofolate ligase